MKPFSRNLLFFYQGMDYAKAAKGALTQVDILRIIDDQSELELNHQLNASEKSLLFSRFSPELIVSRIRKFGYGSFKFMWFLCRRPELKCDISFEAIPRDGNCLLHGKLVVWNRFGYIIFPS